MSKKYKFIFLAGTLGQGGAEKQLYLMTSTLVQYGHNVSVITFGKNEYWENPIKDANIELLYCPFKSKIFRLFYLILLSFKHKPNYLYSIHFYTSGYVGVVSKLIPSIISIGSIRNDGYSEVKANGFWSKYHMSLPNLIISNNLHGKNAIIELFKMPSYKIHILNNSIIDYNLNSKAYSKNDILKIIFVGRMSPEKDPLSFLEICKMLVDKGIKFNADMYGDGVLSSVVKDTIIKLGLANNVFYKGSKPSIATCFHEYNLLISTSLHEGVPNVLLESFCSDLVPFSFKNNAALELYSQFNGLDYFLFNTVSEGFELISKFIEKPDFYHNLTIDFGNTIKLKSSVDFQYKNLIKILQKYNK